jgi:hypothetical protein
MISSPTTPILLRAARDHVAALLGGKDKAEEEISLQLRAGSLQAACMRSEAPEFTFGQTYDLDQPGNIRERWESRRKIDADFLNQPGVVIDFERSEVRRDYHATLHDLLKEVLVAREDLDRIWPGSEFPARGALPKVATAPRGKSGAAMKHDWAAAGAYLGAQVHLSGSPTLLPVAEMVRGLAEFLTRRSGGNCPDDKDLKQFVRVFRDEFGKIEGEGEA